MTLHKITVNYIEPAAKALEVAVTLGGHNQTDTLNRAIQAYARILEETVLNGKKISIHDGEPITATVDPETGEMKVVWDYETLTFL